MKVKEWQARNAIRKINRGKLPSKRQQAALDVFLAEGREEIARSQALRAEVEASMKQGDAELRAMSVGSELPEEAIH